jgi:hypothetical protein
MHRPHRRKKHTDEKIGLDLSYEYFGFIGARFALDLYNRLRPYGAQPR